MSVKSDLGVFVKNSKARAHVKSGDFAGSRPSPTGIWRHRFGTRRYSRAAWLQRHLGAAPFGTTSTVGGAGCCSNRTVMSRQPERFPLVRQISRLVGARSNLFGRRSVRQNQKANKGRNESYGALPCSTRMGSFTYGCCSACAECTGRDPLLNRCAASPSVKFLWRGQHNGFTNPRFTREAVMDLRGGGA